VASVLLPTPRSTADRARSVALAVLVALALAFVISVAGSHGTATISGRLGGDYPAFYGAGTLVRTGQAAHLALPGRPGIGGGDPVRDLIAYTWPTPGLTVATAGWFHDRDVAAVAIDTMVLEVYPCESDDLFLPVHLLHLVEMGMTQGQNWFLDELADACAADGRYSFLLDATPLPLTGALGSPVNPVALR